MSWWQALIFALVEGLTEFIPVSSTAQLLLVEKIFPVANQNLFASFAIFIQLGAVLAVLGVFWQQLWRSRKIWGKLLAALLPTLVLGLILYRIVKANLLESSPLTGWVLIAGAFFFSFLDWWWAAEEKTRHHFWSALKRKLHWRSRQLLQPKQTLKNQTDFDYLAETRRASWRQMVGVGVAQTAAMLPGVSRSAATIFGARALGFSKMSATKLAFVLALPTIAGAAFLDLGQEFLDRNVQVVCGCVSAPCVCPQPYNLFNHPSDFGLMLFGFVLAFLVAFTTANFFIRILGSHPFWYWGILRLITGLCWLLLF